MANKPRIFNGRKDFLLWKFQMMDLLQGVGAVAMLPRVEPDQSSGSTGTRVVQDEERPDPTKHLALALNFDKRCGKGRALLTQYLSPEIAMRLRTEQKNSLSEAWLWLLTKYDKEAEKEQTLLRRKMSQLHLIEGRINEYLSKFELLLAQYRSVGGVLSEKEAIEMVLNNLPTSWLSFVMMVDNLPSQEKTWEGFVSRILLQEERVTDKKSANGLALSAQDKWKRKPKKEEEERKKKCCWKCGKAGHLQRDCPKAKKKKGKKDKKKSSDDDDLLGLVATTFEERSKRSSWILDTGASQHMTYDVRLLSSLRAVRGQFILTADGSKMAVKGIGDVYINMTVNGETKKAVFRDTLYIPELCRNLVSGKVLTERGCTMEFKGTWNR